MEVSRPAITKQITNLRNLGYIEIIKKGFRSTHSNTLKVIFDETQPNVSQLEVDEERIDVEAQKNVIQMINKAFNRQPQLDAQSSSNRVESPTVKAMKEHIKRVKNNAS
jgi:Mn-dependent DtxR family transcriptional regulator